MLGFWQRLRHRLRTHKTLVLAGSVLPWAVFAGLLVAVVKFGSMGADISILTFFHQHATPFLDKLALAFTIVGNTGPMIAVAALVAGGLLLRGRRAEARAFALAVGGSMLLTQVIKALVARPRPALWASLRPEHTYSFPSGHAMDTAALAVALGFLLSRCRAPGAAQLLAPLFALGVGWARVYLGVHNPSDVLAGWSAALGWVVGVQLLVAPAFREPRSFAA